MKDLKRSSTGDLDLSGGDIHWGESTLEHQRNILLAHRGDYRLSPLVGVGLIDFVDDEDPAALKQAISRQFSADGMTVKQITLSGGNINIDANY